jgi:hypothetical protein
MTKRCPPGVICIENVTLLIIAIVLIIIFYLIYLNIVRSHSPNTNNTNNIIIKKEKEERISNPNGGEGHGFFGGSGSGTGLGFFTRPNYGYTNLPGDVLMNPYMPPLRDERYLVAGRMPINVSTNIGAVETTYRQVGILTPVNGSNNKILPLMGRPVNVSRDYWQYYTMSDQNNSVKLPVIRNGKSATNEYGCPKIYNGDSVYVEGYGQAFKTTIYDNDTIRYIPYI